MLLSGKIKLKHMEIKLNLLTASMDYFPNQYQRTIKTKHRQKKYHPFLNR